MKNTQYIIPYDKSMYRYLSDSYTLEIQQRKRYEIAWSEIGIGKTNATTT